MRSIMRTLLFLWVGGTDAAALAAGIGGGLDGDRPDRRAGRGERSGGAGSVACGGRGARRSADSGSGSGTSGGAGAGANDGQAAAGFSGAICGGYGDGSGQRVWQSGDGRTASADGEPAELSVDAEGDL